MRTTDATVNFASKMPKYADTRGGGQKQPNFEDILALWMAHNKYEWWSKLVIYSSAIYGIVLITPLTSDPLICRTTSNYRFFSVITDYSSTLSWNRLIFIDRRRLSRAAPRKRRCEVYELTSEIHRMPTFSLHQLGYRLSFWEGLDIRCISLVNKGRRRSREGHLFKG